MKWFLYGVIVASFTVAGVLDLIDRQWKLGVVALGFAVMNGFIFFWRA